MSEGSNKRDQAEQVSSAIYNETREEKERRDAEETLDYLLLRAGVSNDMIFRRLKIPISDDFNSQNHEIDIVVLNDDGIYCIELNNYNGNISLRKDDSNIPEQHGVTNRSTYSTPAPSPVESIRDKAQILRDHIFEKFGIRLEEKYFHARVVYINKILRIVDEIKKDPHAATYENLPFEKPWCARIINAITPSFISGKLSYLDIEVTRLKLSQLKTCDTIKLIGGRLLIGDYRGGRFERSKFEKITFKHKGSQSRLETMLGCSAAIEVTRFERNGWGWFCHAQDKIEMQPDETISFIILGQSSLKEIPANDIDFIKLSI